MSRTFNCKPAERSSVNLIIGLVGPSSSGKTYTALELATGIQGVTGGQIEMIDTEHGRGLYYADRFTYCHTDFAPPFASLDYAQAITEAAKRSKIIIVDSLSHEHEGEGGMIDYQDAEMRRLGGDDPAKQERVKMLAWAKPKAARRKLLRAITSVDAHLILCFRAKDTSKPGKNAEGKMAVIPMGYMPIAGEEFVFECALSALLLPGAKGRASWQPEFRGEKAAVKLPDQFAWLAEQEAALNRQDGRRLAEWARGGKVSAKPETPASEASAPTTAVSSVALPTEVEIWAEAQDFELEARAGDEAAKWFNDAMKDPMWSKLRGLDAGRAAALKAKALDRRKMVAA